MEEVSYKIEWSDALSMSNAEIDSEHQNFIKLVNDLNGEIASQQRDKTVVGHIMTHILEDAVAHFSNEERLFVKYDYPNAQEHKQIHSDLINKFEQALKEFQNTELGLRWTTIGLEIRNMLVDHVLNEDTKYIEYLRTD